MRAALFVASTIGKKLSCGQAEAYGEQGELPSELLRCIKIRTLHKNKTFTLSLSFTLTIRFRQTVRTLT